MPKPGHFIFPEQWLPKPLPSLIVNSHLIRVLTGQAAGCVCVISMCLPLVSRGLQPFHVFTGKLCIFFGEMSVHFFCPFYYKFILFKLVNFLSLYLNSRFVRYVSFFGSNTFCRWLFTSLENVYYDFYLCLCVCAFMNLCTFHECRP